MSRREQADRPPRRRRWGLRFLMLLVVLGVAGWFLPELVASTPLRQQIVALGAPQLKGSATIGGATLGWLKPVELRDVQLRDTAGGEMLKVPVVTTSNSLWQLALGSRDLGTIRIERPELNLVLRHDGSNLEDALKPLLEAKAKEGGGDGPPLAVVVEVVDGKVGLAMIVDRGERGTDVPRSPGASGTLDKLNVKLTISPSQPEPLSAAVDCMVKRPDAAAGQPLHGAVVLKSAANAGAPGAEEGSASLQLTSVELPPLAPLLVRCAAPLEIAGIATTDLNATWKPSERGPVVTLQGAVGVDQLVLKSSQWLGTDTLRLAQLRIKPDVAYSAGRLDAKAMRADCDLGYIEANGAVDLASWSTGQETQKSLANLAAADFKLTGDIDCAALAQQLPGLVRLKTDTRIDAGRLTIALQSGGEAGKRRLEGAIRATNLVATAAGRRIEYPQPIQVEGSLDAPASGLWIARLHCKSDYLTADAEGSLLDASLSINADLDRLTTDLGRIIDLGQVRAAGRVSAGLEVRRKRNAAGAPGGPEQITADGRVLLDGFQLQAPGVRPWQEQRLTAAMRLQGSVDGTTVTRLDEGEARVDSGADHLVAKLTRAVDKPALTSAWPVSGSLEGELAAWLARAQPWLPLEGWQLAGASRCSLEGTLSTSQCDVQQVHLQLRDFKAVSSSVAIDEPQVEIAGSGQWDAAAKRVSVPTMTVQTSSIALRADKVLWQLDSKSRQAGGDVALRVDLARLSRWLEVPGKTPAFKLAGSVVGRIELSEADGVLKAETTAEAENFVAYAPSSAPLRTAGLAALPATASSAWQPIWSEPKLPISGAASYRVASDQLDLDRFTMDSNVLRLVNLRGSVKEVTGRRDIQLAGELHYDLAKITPLLSPYVGHGVRLVGQGQRAFALTGPLSGPAGSTATVPPELNGNAGIGFTQAEVYGLTTGAGELKAELKQQIVQFAPLKLTIGKGHFAAGPRIELTGSPLLLQDPGRVVDQLDLTPALCQTWLKYVAPLLADATRVDGKFSLDLSKCRVPLADTHKSDVAGKLTIHAARVRPGPVAEPLVLMAKQIEAVVQKKPLDAVGGLLGGPGGGGMPGSDVQLNIQSQDVQFAMQNGRVAHSPIKFVVGNVEIRTSGTVGLDQTLDLIAEVPILPQWVEKQPALRGLANQTLRIPVRGTLGKPALDQRAVESLTRQVGAAAVGGAIEGALQKGLDGLLKPKK